MTDRGGVVAELVRERGEARARSVKFHYGHGDRPVEGYTVRRGVGRGGFGEVYYAVSDGGREVALKLVLQNEEIELRGVRHCINLKSPHLVSIFDVRKTEDGVPCVIMEYVTGPSLRDILDANPSGLEPQAVAFLVREIAAGLVYLHERGIVHRDLKPENIFFEDGFVKIGDYGLAKIIDASARSSQTISVGTVHYVAPEIGSGQYSRSVDIYALGVICYELFTGEVPFQGNSFGEVLMKHLSAQADLTGIAEPFRTAIGGALEKRPDDRFQSVQEMVRGILADPDLEIRMSTFSPVSLSRVARRWPTVRGEESVDPGAVTSPAPEPGKIGAQPATPPGPGDAAGRRRVVGAARQRAPAGGRTPPLVAAAERIDAALQSVAQRISDRVDDLARWRPPGAPIGRRPAERRAAPGVDSSCGGILPWPCWPGWRPPRPRTNHPPGNLARFFWVFVACGLLAASLSCLLAGMTMRLSDEERLACICFAVALAGYGWFGFYRGLWARRPGIWRRTVQPFLVVTFANGALVGLTLSILGRPLGRFRGEDQIAAGILVVASLGLLALISAFTLLLPRWRRRVEETPAGTPWPERPVSVSMRTLTFLLGCILCGTGVGLALAGIFSPYTWDRLPFLCFAVVISVFSVYFFRQSLRHPRGRLWRGTVRPFLISVATAAFLGSLVPFAVGMPLGEDEMLVIISVLSGAAALTAALVILGKNPGARAH